MPAMTAASRRVAHQSRMFGAGINCYWLIRFDPADAELGPLVLATALPDHEFRTLPLREPDLSAFIATLAELRAVLES